MVVVDLLAAIEGFRPLGARLISYAPVRRILAGLVLALKGQPTQRLNHEPRYAAQVIFDEDVPGPLQWSERIADETCPDPLADLIADQEWECVQSALDSLPSREFRVLQLRCGFHGAARSFQDIGAAIGVTRERARQLYLKALSMLRVRLYRRRRRRRRRLRGL